MPEPFKNLVNADTIAEIAAAVATAWPAFDRARFEAAANDGLESRELKDRVRHVAAALRARLPADWSEAADVLGRALPPPLPDASAVSTGFGWWPLLQVIEDHGADAPAVSLPLLREATRRFSAEFAIRPLLVRHPEPTWAVLEAWTRDPDVHVRRLCSEGTRPRLPWGLRLKDAIADPSRGLALVEALKDDPEEYVRRSVANHLNDVAKDHPDAVIAVAARWLRGASPERARLVRHGLRTLLKQGHPGALALYGFGAGDIALEALALDRDAVPFGESVVATATLRNASAHPAPASVEWVVTYARPRGPSRKVFRGPDRTLAPGERWTVRKTFPMRAVTTRKHFPGAHAIAVQVDGAVLGEQAFMLIGGDG